MVHALQKGEDYHTNLNFSFSMIYIIFLLCRRKFCERHIVLVYIVCYIIYNDDLNHYDPVNTEQLLSETENQQTGRLFSKLFLNVFN